MVTHTGIYYIAVAMPMAFAGVYANRIKGARYIVPFSFTAGGIA